MSDFNEFFEALEQSVTNNDFVKLTISKPMKKSEGLQNVYVRFFIIDGKQVFEFKYRLILKTYLKNYDLIVKAEIENLLEGIKQEPYLP